MYNKLQYISQGNTVEQQLQSIRKALDSGCEWIQLRFKTLNTTDLYNLAESTKILCDVYAATLIINDNVSLTQQLNAHGVHLGLNDMSITQARSVLGNTKIIGGTANTFEHVLQRASENCSYIGLGPFQFTTTKDKLSPILGLEGYNSIIEKMELNNITTPVFAIGGIQLKHVESLLQTRIYGIAVSGLITQSENPKDLISQLNQKLYVSI